MLQAAFKALFLFTVSNGLTAVPVMAKPTAVPNPDPSLSLPFAEPWTPGARIDSLVESLVVGRWEIDSRDLGQKEDPEYRYRWVFHFSPDHSVEMRIWLRDGYGGAEGDPPVYFGLEQSGDWFIKQGKIGIISRRCQGLTAPAQRECDIEADEFGDTSYQILQRQENGVFLSSDESAIVHFSFKGRDRNMSAPDFWPEGVSSRASKRNVRNRVGLTGREIPLFDAMGRRAAPGPLTRRYGTSEEVRPTASRSSR